MDRRTGTPPCKDEWQRLLFRAGHLLGFGFALLVSAGTPAFAESNKVRITQLQDISFGTVTNLTSDSVQSENICVYASTATNGYNVRAFGSGSGGAFTLASGTDNLPFEVEWSGAPGQNTGSRLTPNAPLAGQISNATQQTCASGPAASASLILILRSAALTQASAGTYNGSLTVVISPE